MQMRLAFSVATAIRPDILIVDEALSVGDAYFQHKSFARIREFRKQGTTLLLVSHDKAAIQSICDRAILLNQGRLEIEGAPELVMDCYNALLLNSEAVSEAKPTTLKLNNNSISSGTGEATVTNICLLDVSEKKIEIVRVGQEVKLCISVLARKDIEFLVLGIGIKDRLGQLIYGTNSDIQKKGIRNLSSGATLNFTAHFKVPLGPGTYSIHTALTNSGLNVVKNYEWREHALNFTVINADFPIFTGCLWLDAKIEVNSS
jgi:lipopolysaccharide transport system ATP-binding protein